MASTEMLTQTVANLTGAAQIDTVFRDLYLERARELYGPLLSRPDWLRLQKEKGTIEELLRDSREAVDLSDWARVVELTSRIRILQAKSQGKDHLLTLGAAVYNPDEIALDPFSPGLARFLHTSAESSEELSASVVRLLGALEKSDSTLASVFANRRSCFAALSVMPQGQEGPPQKLDPEKIRRYALQAAEAGNLKVMEELARSMMAASGKTGPPTSHPNALQSERKELSLPFPPESEAPARRLGLAKVRLSARLGLADYVSQWAWRSSTDPIKTQEGWIRLLGKEGNPNPSPDSFAPLKEALDLFMTRIFVNSGGARYAPHFQDEQVLAEDFPEGKESKACPRILELLGLERRNGLSRTEIDRALLVRGPGLLREELCLNPVEYRLICIPPDVYSRLGWERKWGGLPQWTHLDGYQVLESGRLRALVGGDVRFGGIFDLASIGRQDERMGVVARFAVVRRARLSVI